MADFNAKKYLDQAGVQILWGKVKDRDDAIVGKSTDTKDDATVYGAKAYADSLDEAMDARMDAVETALGPTGSVATAIKSAIEALDVTDTAVANQFVTAVSETDGKITVSRAALTANDIPALDISKITGLGDRLGAAENDIDALELKVGNTAVATQISTAVSAEEARAELAYAAKSYEDIVDTLVDEDEGKSVREIANEELAAQLIPEDAQDSLDTLQEIAAWIQSHPGDASEMNASISALQGIVAGIGGDGDDYATVIGAINGAIEEVNSATEDLEDRVGTAEGKITTLEGKMTTAESNIGALQTSVGAAADTAFADGSLYARIKQEIADRQALATTVAGLSDVYYSKASGEANALAIATLNGDASTSGSVANAIAGEATARDAAIATAINALDATVSQTAGAGNGGLSLRLTEVDGIVTGISGAIATDTYDAHGSASAAETNAKTYADTQDAKLYAAIQSLSSDDLATILV